MAARADATATVRAVRRITAPATTRLIVEFTEPVHYRLQRIDARPELGIPPRLYVAFPDTNWSDPAQPSTEPVEGPLVRLRGAQNAGGARLILDVPGLTDFGIFPMPDPFRLIIDVRGTARVGPARPTPAPAPLVASAPPPKLYQPAPTAAQSAPRRRFKIVLDPGHGGKDPRAPR